MHMTLANQANKVLLLLTKQWTRLGYPNPNILCKLYDTREHWVWWDGEFWSGQPYLRERLSLKAALCKAKLCSSMGSAVNQVEAPFSWESSKEHGVVWLCWNSFASSFCFVHLVCWILLLMLCWTEWQLPNWWSWLMIRSTSGALIYCEAACCSFAEAAGFVKPKPPSHAGSANISRICSPGGGCPVSAGIKSEWIAFSRDSRMSSDWFSSQSVTLKKAPLWR